MPQDIRKFFMAAAPKQLSGTTKRAAEQDSKVEEEKKAEVERPTKKSKYFDKEDANNSKSQNAVPQVSKQGTNKTSTDKAAKATPPTKASDSKPSSKTSSGKAKRTASRPAKRSKQVLVLDSDDDFQVEDNSVDNSDDDFEIDLDDTDDDAPIIPPQNKRSGSKRGATNPPSTASPRPAPPATTAIQPRVTATQKPAPPPLGAPSPTGKGASRGSKASKVVEPLDADKAAAMAAVEAAVKLLPPESGVKFTMMEAADGGGWGARPDDTPPNHGNKEIPRGHPDCLFGKTFVISGVLDSLTRSEAEHVIKRHGGRVTGNVSGKTNFLLVGSSCGQSKFRQAKDKGTKLIDEDGLLSLIMASQAILQRQKAVEEKQPAQQPVASTTAVPRDSGRGAPPPSGPASGIMAKGGAAPGPSTISSDGQLWVEKHKPRNAVELVGNNTLVATLRQWLLDWDRVHLHGGAPSEGGPGRGTKQRDLSKKSVLLSGPPGIGKTSSAQIICRELGFEPVEVNASDARGKADKDSLGGIGGKLANSIKELSTNTTLITKDGRQKKVCIIMDEVDGMSGNQDRGGVQDLLQSIHKSKVPIICICNDKYAQKLKSLRNHCLELDYRKPTKPAVVKRMLDICRKEGLSVNEAAMDALVEGANGDIRLILGQLQMVRYRAKSLSYDDVKGKLGATKDFEMSPFEAARQLLSLESSQMSLGDQLDCVFQDMDLVPLLIQENYVNHKPSVSQGNELTRMQLIAKAADAFSCGDVVNRRVRQNQQWSLMPFAALMSSVYPATYMRGFRETFNLYPNEPNFPRFTAWLGQNSSSGKQRRLLGEFHTRLISSDAPAVDRTELRLYYMPALKRVLTLPLKEKEKEGIPEVIDSMHQYCIARDDLDYLVDVTKFKTKAAWCDDPMKDIPTQVKTAFTRAFNQSGGKAKCGLMLEDVKTRKSKKATVEIEVEEAEDDTGGGEGDAQVKEEEEEEDLDLEAKKAKAQQMMKKKGISLQLAETKGKKGRASGSGTAAGRGSGKSTGRASGRGRGKAK